MKINHWKTIGPEQIDDIDHWLSTRKFIGLDTEFNGYKLFTTQIGDKDTSFVIEPSETTMPILKRVLQDETKTFIGHNIKADYKVLKANGIVLRSVWDTMVMEIILNGGGTDLKYSLDMLTNRYCGVILDKSLQSSFLRVFDELTKEQIEYAAHDVEYLDAIRLKQVERLKVLNLMYLSSVENNAVLATADMEFNGMKISTEKLATAVKQLETEKKAAFEALDEIVIKEPKFRKYVPVHAQGNLFAYEERKVILDYNSPVQIVASLQQLGYGVTSSEESGLLKYYNESEYVRALLHYREKTKGLSTYGNNLLDFIDKYDDRIHSSYWPAVQTGRFSSSKPNLQNIPKNEFRSIFVPEKGWKIVSADYAGIELKLIAEGSKDPVFLTTMNDGGDLHSIVAALLFNVDLDQVREPLDRLRGKTPRDVAKTINYGLAYGMSEYKLARDLMIPVEDARAIITDYFKRFPRIKKFLDALGGLGVSRGYIRSFAPTRRIRYYKDWNDPRIDDKRKGEIDRESRNFPMQAANADMLKIAMYDIWKETLNNNYPVKIINVVHDEINTEVREDFAETWKPIMDRIMCDAGRIFIKTVPVTVDSIISDSWYKEP